jgi:hypothetical protein
MPPKKTIATRPYERTDAPPVPTTLPAPVWALAVVPTVRLGVKEYSIVAVQVQGDRVLQTVVVPDSNWEKMEGALQDFRRCAVRMFRFGDTEALLAGRS